MQDQPNLADLYSAFGSKRHQEVTLMQDQPNERIAGLEARRATLQIIIKLGREAVHGPLGEIERGEAWAHVRNAEQELEQIERELRRCPECGAVQSGR